MELGATSYLRPSILPTIPPLRVPRRNEIHTARTTQEYTSNRDANYSPPPHQIRLVSYIGSKGASFPFDPIICECREGAPSIRIGRFSEETFERADFRFTGKITFKSRVVSRRHAELWCGLDGKFYIQDTSSSSGTFVNGRRLSKAGIKSLPSLIENGDTIQLGVDYQQGKVEDDKCVMMRVGIGQEERVLRFQDKIEKETISTKKVSNNSSDKPTAQQSRFDSLREREQSANEKITNDAGISQEQKDILQRKKEVKDREALWRLNETTVEKEPERLFLRGAEDLQFEEHRSNLQYFVAAEANRNRVGHPPPPEETGTRLMMQQSQQDTRYRNSQEMSQEETEINESTIFTEESDTSAHSNLVHSGDGAAAPEQDGESTLTLEMLMMSFTPVDLSGGVSIPDRGHPAQGGLADVHAGLLEDQQVAVKILRIRKNRWADPDWEASNLRRITREMHVWAALKHRNICEFLGYATGFSDYPAMISTWCHRGTVSEYLEGRDLSLDERFKLARDVSDGLQFLHGLKVVHGDLKPSNVLVDNDGVAKLCDFGLVRLVDWQGPAGLTTTSPYTGTERYKAPELFKSENNTRPVATAEGDIYSLGCILLELIEDTYPFRRFPRANELEEIIKQGHAPALRTEASGNLGGLTEFFWNLLEACWGEPVSRPDIWVVDDALDYFERTLAAGLSA